MKKRVSKRFSVCLEGEVIYKNKTYSAYMGNVSEKGVYVLITPVDVSKKPSNLPEKAVQLRFHIEQDTMINVICRKRWISTLSSRRSTKHMGLEIIDPPSEYKKYIQSLQEF
ncbi:MAG: hypothetical protein GTN53_09105 [Candidatus Aminicenantes bacterium]|nr:hypothetical protein [Candidatus Aminicenantes bacterium]NIQ66617.1 hypothetical protein [Candidatus Aminicenantes bacterium]NIT22646.1 hypothetical protein [Candidatus Aminicenantes bacterium]